MLAVLKNKLSHLLSALFLQKRRLYTMPLLAVGISVLWLVTPLPAAASLWSLLGELVLWIAKLIGGLVITLIDILIQIVQYNDFINAPAVVKGWVIVRDVVNMFIIVMMLVIAFATVFRIEEYQYKKLLSKLLIMAVLVNFSKMLTGFFIDFAQVIMLTFVNGFKEAAAGNFVNGFKIKEMYEFAQKTDQGASGGDFLVAALLALISLSITLVVIAVYLVVFLLRIVFLWLLTIISPLAYVLSAFPGQAKKYSSEWWDYFGKYVTTGPILAFFLWLALAVMQFDSDAFGTAFRVQTKETAGVGTVSASISSFGQSDVLLSFIINIILLLGGLWMTQRLGVAGGKLAGAALNKIQSAGAKIAKGAALAPFKTYGWAARKVGAGKVPGLRWLKGYELNPVKVFKNLQEGMKMKKHTEELELQGAAASRIDQGGVRGLLASTASSDIAFNLQGFLFNKTIRGLFKNRKHITRLGQRRDQLRKEAYAESASDGALEHVDKGGELTDKSLQEKVKTANKRVKKGEDKDRVMAELFTEEESKQLYDEGVNILKKEQDQVDSKRRGVVGRQQEGGSFTYDQNVKEEMDEIDKQIKDKEDEIKNQEGEIDIQIKLAEDEIKKVEDRIRQGMHDFKLGGPDYAGLEALKKEHNEVKSRTAAELDELKNKRGVIASRAITDEERSADKKLISNYADKSKKIEDKLSQPYLSPTERIQKREQATNVEKKMKTLESFIPQNFYARNAFRAGVFEKMRLITTANQEELRKMFRSALGAHDPELASGVLLRAAQASHTNEIMEEMEFPTSGPGFNDFINKIFIHDLHIDPQQAYALQNDVSNIAEDNGWWQAYGQSISVRDGVLCQRPQEERENACVIEMEKRSVRGAVRDWNRGGYMNEEPVDWLDPARGRRSTYGSAGLAFLGRNYSKMKDNIREFNPNHLANLNTFDNQMMLEQLGRQITAQADRLIRTGIENNINIGAAMKVDWKNFMEGLNQKLSSGATSRMGSAVEEMLHNARRIIEEAVGNK